MGVKELNQRVMVVVAHQDDESLFCGDLLYKIHTTCNITLICMSKPKFNVTQRNEAFIRVAKELKAAYILTDFQDSDRSNQSLADFKESRKSQLLTMIEFLNATIQKIKPDIIITHNKHGEYGHCYHKVVSNICTQINKTAKLYYFGYGILLRSDSQNCSEHKRKLLKLSGLRGFEDIACQPEQFVLHFKYLI